MSLDRHRKSILIFDGQSGAFDPIVFEWSQDPDDALARELGAMGRL